MRRSNDDFREEMVREEQGQLGDPSGNQNYDDGSGVEPKVHHQRSRVRLQLRLYASPQHSGCAGRFIASKARGTESARSSTRKAHWVDSRGTVADSTLEISQPTPTMATKRQKALQYTAKLAHSRSSGDASPP